MNLTVLQDLRAALAELHAYEARLTARDATPQLLRELDQGLTLARRLVAAVGNLPVTGCRAHPDGPVDHEAGGCLLCNTRRRATTALPPADIAVETVLAAIEEHGHEAAVHRYGPRPVTRALAAAGRHTTSNLPPEYRQEATGD
ncbi:hypothetical protein [Streptomyces sp. CCM_MD2014]|uniref:hypothetical protein n=1 Tax=Streptomyces sp. CCM_MD2014 TaxID=1561022 RepID=UPI00052A85C0|nr:hypothetical protein [Streptomyces sp. CCM_MD2014]AIV35558.1 hypothetical protein NI25_20340 [Streptomyces sp. CCM_MD2014]